MPKKNGSTTSVQPASTSIIIILIIFRHHGIPQSLFPIYLEVGDVTFPTNSISPNYPIKKAWKYRMIA